MQSSEGQFDLSVTRP
nr:unnamed protein product [Callosobruchus chinensis]